MFEKEAVERYKKHLADPNYYETSEEESYLRGFRDGAEFEYNKANEWNTEKPSSSVGNKDLLLRVAKDDFDVGYYHFENKKFYTNDGREVTPFAWKEIRYPQESE